MFLGKVVGTLWSTVKWPQLGGLKLLMVQPYNLNEAGLEASAGEAVVCADLLDAGVGDRVIIAYGHAARVAAWEATLGGEQNIPQAPPVPIDAAVVAIVDDLTVEAMTGQGVVMK